MLLEKETISGDEMRNIINEKKKKNCQKKIQEPELESHLEEKEILKIIVFY